MGIEEYNTGVAVAIVVLNAVSATSLLFIMGVYLSGLKTANNFPMRMVFYLCIACLLQNIYVFIMNPFQVHQEQTGTAPTTPLCNFEGVFKTMADLSSVIWTSLILFSAYYSIVRDKSADEMKKLQVWFLLLGFGLPLILGILPLSFSLYGYDGYYCWFRAGVITEFWLSMGFYYIPLWVMFALNIYMTKSTLSRLKDLCLDQEQLAVFKRLLWYPVILFVTAVFSTLHKIQQVATNNSAWLWLITLDYVLFSLYGLFNAIAYGLNPNIRMIIRDKFCGGQQRTESNITKQIFLQQFN